MIQGKLGSLVGRSSGYIESLPAPVRRRISGLKGVQKEHAKLEAEFQEEVLQLEKKYFAKYTPLYQKRAQIVNGVAEPTEEEVVAGKAQSDDEEEEESKLDVKAEDKAEVKEDLKGVPEFWLSAMKNHYPLAETITDRDEAALKFLTDIRMTYLDRPGFKLIFEFAENEFFTNKEITKTYYYQEESGYGGDFIYDHAEGDKINWKEGKDLTVRLESKKQRNKSMAPSNIRITGFTNNYLQTPSRLVLLSAPFLPRVSSISLTPPSLLMVMTMKRITTRSSKRDSNLIIILVKISRRSLSPVLLTGIPARPFNSRSWRTKSRVRTLTTTMTMI